MPNNDPAVTQAAEMWNQGQRREAMRILVNRVEQLADHIENTPIPHRSGTFRGFILGTLTIFVIGAAFLVLSNRIDSDDNKQSLIATQPVAETEFTGTCYSATEWLNYAATPLIEFIVTAENGPSDFYDPGELLNFGNELKGYQQQLESVNVPFCAAVTQKQLLLALGRYQIFFLAKGYELQNGEAFEGVHYQDRLEEAESTLAEAYAEIEILTGFDMSEFSIEING